MNLLMNLIQKLKFIMELNLCLFSINYQIMKDMKTYTELLKKFFKFYC